MPLQLTAHPLLTMVVNGRHYWSKSTTYLEDRLKSLTRSLFLPTWHWVANKRAKIIAATLVSPGDLGPFGNPKPCLLHRVWQLAPKCPHRFAHNELHRGWSWCERCAPWKQLKCAFCKLINASVRTKYSFWIHWASDLPTLHGMNWDDLFLIAGSKLAAQLVWGDALICVRTLAVPSLTVAKIRRCRLLK